MADEADEAMDGRLLHRLVFFTDAVFAIVLTLLVLELRPPAHGEGLRAAPLFAFTLSFAIVAIFWLAHMSTTRKLARFDWPTAVANLVFLFPVCLIPFVSGWVGEAVTGTESWLAYSVVMIATSLANMALLLVEGRGGGRLMQGGFTPRERAWRLARAASPGVAFTVGLVGALAGDPRVPMFATVLIPPLMLLARLLWGPKKAAAEGA